MAAHVREITELRVARHIVPGRSATSPIPHLAAVLTATAIVRLVLVPRRVIHWRAIAPHEAAFVRDIIQADMAAPRRAKAVHEHVFGVVVDGDEVRVGAIRLAAGLGAVPARVDVLELVALCIR